MIQLVFYIYTKVAQSCTSEAEVGSRGLDNQIDNRSDRSFASRGHVTCFSLKIIIICMVYDLKNTMNGKSMIKLARWPSLSPLAF